MTHFHNYISGVFTSSNSSETFANTNPADRDDCIGIFPNSNAIDINDAVHAASLAFNS
jgi:aldehyde dehydrogenase (NAD+)